MSSFDVGISSLLLLLFVRLDIVLVVVDRWKKCEEKTRLWSPFFRAENVKTLN